MAVIRTKRCAVTLSCVFGLMVWGHAVLAKDPPHDAASGGGCLSCHAAHPSGGDDFHAVNGNINQCLSCHTKGGLAGLKCFYSVDQATIGKEGTSHRWDSKGLVYAKWQAPKGSTGSIYPGGWVSSPDTVHYDLTFTVEGDTGTAEFEWTSSASTSGAGITGASVPLENSLWLRFEDGPASATPSFVLNSKARVYANPLVCTHPMIENKIMEGTVVCSTCHDQHYQIFDRPFLRMPNAGNAICKSCHGDRDKGLFASDSGNVGTHPVGIGYATPSAKLHDSPGGLTLDDEGTAGDPSDDTIECLTCHGVHYDDSDSDGDPDSLGLGDGCLLRTKNDDTLCTACHTYPGHNGMGCRDCHAPHALDSPNVFLVKPWIDGREITFVDRDHGDGVTDYIKSNHPSPSYDGICEVCHTATAYHRNNASGNHEHYKDLKCTDCHLHEDGFTPSGGSCTDCHGQPPDGSAFPNTAGSHATHMTAVNGPGILDCTICHASSSAATHRNDLASFASGTDQNVNGNIELDETDVCDTCHSPDGAFDGVGDTVVGAKTNWFAGVYASGSLAPGKGMWCAGCHDEGTSLIQGVNAPAVAGDDTTWGYYATGHGRSHAISCMDCHEADTPHTDGIAHTYVAASDNYQAAFRLGNVNGGPPLLVPRTGLNWQDPFNDPPYWELCFSCHNKYELLGSPMVLSGSYSLNEFGTNFRSDVSVIIPDGLNTDIAGYSVSGATDVNSHYSHLKGQPTHYDSDRDGATDSYGTCVSCHNVHGSASPAMVRDGKLLGMEPALNFSHVRYDRHDSLGGCPNAIVMTSAGPVPLMESQGGVMRANGGPLANGVCNFCHGGGAGTGDPEYAINCFDPDNVDYYREPVETGVCTTCHSQPQGARRAVAPDGGNPNDFGKTSHHVQGDVQGSDCIVCHDMTQHQQGYVRLKDPDNNNIVYVYEQVTSAEVETFCINCHDADGAVDGPGAQPFGDGQTAPDIDRGGDWAASAHATGGTTNSGYSCIDCHGNGHGSNLRKMLLPWDGSSGPDNVNEEEGFCYGCHGAGGVSNEAISNGWFGASYSNFGENVEQAFSLHSAHPVADASSGHVFDIGNGPQELECTSCHPVHQSTGKYWEATSGKTPVGLFTTAELWGAPAGEKIGTYDPAKVYQPPSLGDPGLDLSGNQLPIDVTGNSLLTTTVQPDYNTLCLACHQYAVGSCIAIDFSGKKHGSADAEPEGPAGWPLSSPYVTADRGEYFLGCLDCHEAHGSENAWLIKRSANGATVPSVLTETTTVDWIGLCDRCHQSDPTARHHNDDVVYNKLGLTEYECIACHEQHGPEMYTSCVASGCHGHNDFF